MPSFLSRYRSQSVGGAKEWKKSSTHALSSLPQSDDHHGRASSPTLFTAWRSKRALVSRRLYRLRRANNGGGAGSAHAPPRHGNSQSWPSPVDFFFFFFFPLVSQQERKERSVSPHAVRAKPPSVRAGRRRRDPRRLHTCLCGTWLEANVRSRDGTERRWSARPVQELDGAPVVPGSPAVTEMESLCGPELPFWVSAFPRLVSAPALRV